MATKKWYRTPPPADAEPGWIDEYAEAVRELEQGEMLTVAQVAQRLNCGRPTIYKAIANRQLGAVRLGNGPNPPIRVPEVELDRYVARSTIGGDLDAKAQALVARRGESPDDAEAYARALKDLDYDGQVFIDRTAKALTAAVEDAHQAAGHRTLGTHQLGGSDIVDVEAIVNEELNKLGHPLPVEISALGPRGLGKAAIRILHDKGLTEYDAADYRRAIKQAIREALNPKRQV